MVHEIEGTTLLHGCLLDQAALWSVLLKLHRLGAELLEVRAAEARS